MSSVVGGRKNKNKKKAEDGEKVTSKEEEEALRKDAQELKTWIDMIETMDDQQLKGYLEDHAGEIKVPKIQKPKKKVQSTRKPNSSSTGKPKPSGILASVWRFHKN
ncbi:hypothetical protein DEO72_LG5g2317 [Vigna unguiculata]|uniref:Uncharacterized protein n=1 Tax=Vigna unguiculata TaxID=3917 RepID=A0A4D6M230_VIGUN|nr:hypothetical protein DEO72_LG5g2317 [Vigna unguiculata]